MERGFKQRSLSVSLCYNYSHLPFNHSHLLFAACFFVCTRSAVWQQPLWLCGSHWQICPALRGPSMTLNLKLWMFLFSFSNKSVSLWKSCCPWPRPALVNSVCSILLFCRSLSWHRGSSTGQGRSFKVKGFTLNIEFATPETLGFLFFSSFSSSSLSHCHSLPIKKIFLNCIFFMLLFFIWIWLNSWKGKIQLFYIACGVFNHHFKNKSN